MTVAEPPVQISLQRILVATDFSERSEQALLTALEIARRHGGELHLLHAVPAEGYGVTRSRMPGRCISPTIACDGWKPNS